MAGAGFADGSVLLACRRPLRRYFSLMAFLTRREQTLVAFVLLAFLLGFGTKQWRETHAVAPVALETEGLR